jgi:REP element-mobilizing transposase RayT
MPESRNSPINDSLPGGGGRNDRSSGTGRAGPLGPPPSDFRLPQRKKLPHDLPAWARKKAIFFLTICCRQRGLNQLCSETVAVALFEAVAFRQRSGRWYVHLLLLMLDHLHALVSFPSEADMSKVVANFKELTAKRAGISWQRDFFDHRLRGRESLQEKWNYILMNPVRKGLVDHPEAWPYIWLPSSAGDGGPRGPALPSFFNQGQSL